MAWKIEKSPLVKRVYLHPGNDGTQRAGFTGLDASVFDRNALSLRCAEASISLIVIGPEFFLSQGYANFFRSEGFLVVGPNCASAELETSKIFAKRFMERAGIPTPSATVCNNPKEFDLFLCQKPKWPLVLKYDGLAAGKGVVVAQHCAEASTFAKRVWEEKEFGRGGPILIEECLTGVEMSYLGLCDGSHFLPLATATDFKRVGEGNTGHNTGGMGALSPSPHETESLITKVNARIVSPLLAQLRRDRLDYRGVLYVGLMIVNGNPYVLEFNARFGDPETQAILLRLESDIVPLLLATAQGQLGLAVSPVWSIKSSVFVVAAANGYPGKIRTGDRISGVDSLNGEVTVFFSGIKVNGNDLVTNGGRVLGLGALGDNTGQAREVVYRNLQKINWDGIHYRRDIGGDTPHDD